MKDIKINCDKCNASKYAGFSKTADDTEFCLLFNKKLETQDKYTTKPCLECNGEYFKNDEWYI